MSSAGVVAISPFGENSIMFSPAHSQDSSESIVIYVAMSGSGLMVPVRVLESDSIVSVKLKIQNYGGFVAKNQKLVCGGRELARSDSLVREYGVSDGNVVHLVLRMSDLLEINVRTSCGKEFSFHAERNRDVGYVKRQLAKKRDGLVSDIDDQDILCEGEKLEDHRIISDICKDNIDGVIHLFVRKSATIRSRPSEENLELSIVATKLNDVRDYDSEKKFDSRAESEDTTLLLREPTNRELCLEPIIVNPKVELSSVICDMINSTLEGLESGKSPIRSFEGTGGAYFMMDALGNKYISVFKPIDEEPMAVNNPRGLPMSEDGEGLKKGTTVGEGAFREVAAYILDHPKNGRRSFSGEGRGFAGVPPTVLVKCLHSGFNHPEGITPKVGSLQMFMENCGTCEDMGPSAFPVEEVHKISVLDIRMANADRHVGNILVNKGEDGQFVLIPIDHGYCLPNRFEDCTFDWLYWPQARQPFSQDTVDYIKSLDAEEDIALLAFYGWDLPLECARTLRISTMLLKKGVEKGLTPFAIGSLMCRENLNKKSVIEEIVQEADDSVLPGSSESAYMESISEIMDRHLNAIA